jgi:hypothetical protein
MNKIYQFFAEMPETIATKDDLFGEIESETTAMLDLFNLTTKNVVNLSQAELFTLHNALVRVKYFQETGKVLTEKGLK